MKFRSFDGAEIYVHEWTEVEQPKAVVQIVHGMTEHAARYDAFARFLNGHGYVVVADDHRGHGLTDPDSLGYHAGDMFMDTVRDEGEITDRYRAKYPGLKYFLFGFSYGSFLTQRYISDYAEKIDGAVIGGSSYKKDAEVYAGSLVSHLGRERTPARLIEKLSFGAYSKKFEDGQWLSNDPENNEKYAGDPLSGFTCSNRFYRDFFKGLRSLYTKKYVAGLRKDLPLLLVSGENDPVGNMGKGVRKLYDFYTRKGGMSEVSLVLFPNSRHEFLNEAEGREEKWGTLLAFFENVVRAPRA